MKPPPLAYTIAVAVLSVAFWTVLLYGFPKVTRALYDVPRVLWSIDACAGAIPNAGV